MFCYDVDRIRILIADDHQIVRVGLKGLLGLQPDIEIVGEAEDGNAALEFVARHVVDVILMDLDMGVTNGVDTTREIKRSFPDVKVIALTMHHEYDRILAMLQAGASGYLLKNASATNLADAVHNVVEGRTYFSPEVSETMLLALTSAHKVTRRGIDNQLTQRETEVLRLIAQEFSNHEIADKLFISVRTVDTHRRNILEKIQAKNTAGLVKYAIEKQII